MSSLTSKKNRDERSAAQVRCEATDDIAFVGDPPCVVRCSREADHSGVHQGEARSNGGHFHGHHSWTASKCPECGLDWPEHICIGEPSSEEAARLAAEDRTAAYVADGETLDALRRGLLAQMSAWSEENWCAGWMSGTEEMLHEKGGVWEILGRQVGWPTGYEHDAWFAWVTWDEAGRIFEERKAARV